MDKDTIYRQAAIDALDEQIRQCDKALSAFDISMKDAYAVKVERASLVAFRETLEYMPSAQPDLQPTCNQLAKDANVPCKDTINRKDAIIAVRSHRIDINDPKKIVRKSYEDVIRELPSAQPEIIRCRDCKYYISGSDDVRYCFNHDDDILWKDDDFCSYAKRRTDD